MNSTELKETLNYILDDDFEAYKHDLDESLEDWPDRDKAQAIYRVLDILDIVDEILDDAGEADITNHEKYNRLWDAMVG